jgi:hypothetical protein
MDENDNPYSAPGPFEPTTIDPRPCPRWVVWSIGNPKRRFDAVGLMWLTVLGSVAAIPMGLYFWRWLFLGALWFPLAVVQWRALRWLDRHDQWKRS